MYSSPGTSLRVPGVETTTPGTRRLVPGHDHIFVLHHFTTHHSPNESHFPVRAHARGEQERALDGDLDELDLVAVLAERPGALGGGPPGGGGGRLGHLAIVQSPGGGLGDVR